MLDPLYGWPDLMSVRTLASLLGVSYRVARLHAQAMPHINVGLGTKNQALRVSKEVVRATFFTYSGEPRMKIVR